MFWLQTAWGRGSSSPACAGCSRGSIGTDKDSDKRQLAAIEGYAKCAGLDVIAAYYDAAVSGADPIDMRPGFTALLQRIEGNAVRDHR